MKNFDTSRTLVMGTLAAMFLAGALRVPTISADQSPDIRPTAPRASLQGGFDAQKLAPLRLLGFEVPTWMLSDSRDAGKAAPPPGHDDFPLDCSDYSGPACGAYVYPGDGCCCVPLAPPAGAFCPDICV